MKASKKILSLELFNLNGKIAVVTGGSQGIGFAISRGLAEAGASVVIANRKAEEGKRAAASLRSENLAVTAIAADVSDMASLDRLATKTMAEFGQIDILVNSAGVIVRKAPEAFTEAEWDFIFDINLKGLFFCCQRVGREMIKRGKGKIINITSNVSEVAMPGRSVYSASKAGVAHLTRNLALEWAQYGIHVNALGPGPTMTEINRSYFEEHPQDLKDRIGSMPLARIGISRDHVGAAVFLASEASDFVTGQNLLVDGGSTIW